MDYLLHVIGRLARTADSVEDPVQQDLKAVLDELYYVLQLIEETIETHCLGLSETGGFHYEEAFYVRAPGK